MMKALAYLGLNEVGIVSKPIPEPGPDDAVVKTTASLICTSDVHIAHGVIPFRTGQVLGHESVGVVCKLGRNVKRSREGDRVAVNACTPCGRCDDCQRGFGSQCGGLKCVLARDGKLAEYFLVNDADYNLAPIPPLLSDEQALYTTDMLSTGLAGAVNAEIPPGGTVAVFAQGPLGLCATSMARMLGAGLVIAVESKPERKTLARRMGADVVVDPVQGDVIEQIMGLTGGEGVDAAIEALGRQETFANCIQVTRPGGVISHLGCHGESREGLVIPLAEFGCGMSDKKIRSARCPGGRAHMARLLRLIETGRVDPLPLTTHRFHFDEAERAFRLLESKAENIIKPLLSY